MAIPIYQDILKIYRKGVNNARIADLCLCSRKMVSLLFQLVSVLDKVV